MRVAYLDKTNSNQNVMCPSGLREHIFSSRLTCRRDDTSAGCSSVRFTTHELSYSKVCGRITAFTAGTPEGFMRTDDTDINGTYVDGVSLTHGAPRQHIWTFAATSGEVNRMFSCSCNNSNTAGTPPPEYVGNDYFCDTRFRESGVDSTSSNACCSFNNPPWFYKQLPQPTTDDIEMRMKIVGMKIYTFRLQRCTYSNLIVNIIIITHRNNLTPPCPSPCSVSHSLVTGLVCIVLLLLPSLGGGRECVGGLPST